MPAEPVTLARLAAACAGRVIGDGALVVRDVTHDSRAAGPGVLFVAIRGARTDGHRFVSDVVAAGGPAAVEDAAVLPAGASGIVVADGRAALAPLAVACHGNPSADLRVVGVTGTNGKTTTTHMLEEICRAAGIPEAIVGTVGARIRGEAFPLERTTPEAADVQRLLRRMADAGVGVVAMEVSSHALTLGRVAGIGFVVGAFTNLSQDHLDFHPDMAAYEAAKASLFTQCRQAVIWTDDPAGSRIAAGLSIPTHRVGTGAGCDLVVADVSLAFGGSRFVLRGATAGEIAVDLPMPGRFNVANAAVAAGCALALGIEPAAIRDGLGAVRRVPGRFELVETAAPATVIVDYAHTPDGIVHAVSAAREILAGTGRVIAVVGAGGDRDRAKRPLMGRAASDADLAVLTSDNPRSEDPATILEQVAAGATGPGRVVYEVDRRSAIRLALAEARPGDAVLILGKGHEQGQDFGDRVVPFDDRTVAREEAVAR